MFCELKIIPEMIGVKLDTKALEILDEIEKQKVPSKDGEKKPAHSKKLKEHLNDIDTKSKRNSTIINAIEDGYTQVVIKILYLV